MREKVVIATKTGDVTPEEFWKDLEIARKCSRKNMGFIGMKGLAGGLITNSKAAMSFILQFDQFVPIWGVQKEEELEE